jgi:two-component system chemotaxis response regulator CheB
MSAEAGHPIVAIGASAGGIEALSELVASLPADLPATILVVQHLQAGFSSTLPELLTARGKLKATHALHGEKIVPGRIYVAPPDNHIVVRRGYLNVVRGPKENNHRPSVDVLFRSASAAYGPGVVGVVLTGFLDCGTAGLLSIKARGGLAVAQDPADAREPEMPRSAIAHAQVDHVAPLREMAALIARLVAQPPGARPADLPHAISELEGDELGVPSDFVCPLCQGRLTETALNGFESFRCHVGHAFSLQSVASEQADAVERALWAAVRALEETAAVSRRLAANATGNLRSRFEEKSEAQAQYADSLRQILLDTKQPSPTDAAAIAEEE